MSKREWLRVPQEVTEAVNDDITEHFRCECGHEWQRQMEDGLVAIGCPVCRCQHLTSLGRMLLPLMESET